MLVSRERRRGTLLAVGVTALMAATLMTPTIAMAADDGATDITENGGATRNTEDRTAAVREALVDGPAKNVILLIGDGMGDSEITVARNYAEGASGAFAGIDALPLTGSYTTYSLREDGTANYASESASTASAWSTGTKAINGQLSIDVNGVPQATLLELAKANGMRTGDVSTAEIQDATPGAQISHISQRGCYGPDKTSANCASEALENGGLGSISEQLLNLRPDVTLGGGSASFTQTAKAGPWEGATLFEQAADRGYQVVDDAEGLAGVTAADQNAPLLGLFTPGNFPVRWQGPEATVGGGDAAPTACTENPERLDTGLSLGSLTQKAIELLDNDNGFFLQVEGASIDKQNHAANACAQIGETVDLDEATQVALAYAQQNQDTLVVVTADHAHTSQIVGSTPPGLSVNLQTVEGGSMIVSYGTAEAGGSQQHTGSQVRVAGYGPGAANLLGLTDQTDLFFTSAGALELNRDLKSLSADATISASAAEVAPGATVTVSVDGLNADWQASVASDAAAAKLAAASSPQRDVLSGRAEFTVTAPTEVGTHSVTVTGAQTGVVLTTDITVTETPTTPAPTDPADGGAGALPGGQGGAGAGGGLAITGAAVPYVLLAIAVAMIAVGGYTIHRRRMI